MQNLTRTLQYGLVKFHPTSDNEPKIVASLLDPRISLSAYR